MGQFTVTNDQVLPTFSDAGRSLIPTWWVRRFLKFYEEALMKTLLRLTSAAALVAAFGATAIAQTTPSNRPCKRGEQRIGGVCKPLTRTAPSHGSTYRAPGTTKSGGATQR